VRFLCLSDIHGHAQALSAVLATAERRGYERILVAGDICFPGPEPLETWRRLSRLQALCVQGVGDRAIATVDTTVLHPRDDFERARLQRLIEVRQELGDAILVRLAKLPQLARQPLDGGRQLVLVHGSPLDPMEPFTHDMDDRTMAHLLADDPADIVLCGGSHVPFDRIVKRPNASDTIPVETRIINVGSVGEAPDEVAGDAATALDLEQQGAEERGAEEQGATDEDEMTGPPSGPRFAHATFIESTDNGIEVEQFVVPLGRAA
jgi:predicted phosphodiesterase